MSTGAKWAFRIDRRVKFLYLCSHSMAGSADSIHLPRLSQPQNQNSGSRWSKVIKKRVDPIWAIQWFLFIGQNQRQLHFSVSLSGELIGS
jgi:hypothetical protein